VAISVDDRELDLQMLLIFNPQTGELRAYETLKTREHLVISYALYAGHLSQVSDAGTGRSTLFRLKGRRCFL
jgi:hypothetical protein